MWKHWKCFAQHYLVSLLEPKKHWWENGTIIMPASRTGTSCWAHIRSSELISWWSSLSPNHPKQLSQCRSNQGRQWCGVLGGLPRIPTILLIGVSVSACSSFQIVLLDIQSKVSLPTLNEMHLMLVMPCIEYHAHLLLEMALSHLLCILAIREKMRVSNMYSCWLGACRVAVMMKLHLRVNLYKDPSREQQKKINPKPD